MMWFWNIRWISVLPPNVELLVYILIYADSTLARKLIEETATDEFNDLAQIILNFDLRMDSFSFFSDDSQKADVIQPISQTFNAPMIKVFAQIAVPFSVQEGFKFLLEGERNDADYTGYTALLLSSIALHGHVIYEEHVCNDVCPVQLLLSRGADPNGRDYRVTPLQMTVSCWDYEGVETLLKAGADPNGVGDVSGIALETDDILRRFSDIENLSPLQIFETVDCLLNVAVRDGKISDWIKIEGLLLKYGAGWTDSLSASEIE